MSWLDVYLFVGVFGFVWGGYWCGMLDEKEEWHAELQRRGIIYEGPDQDTRALYWRDGHKKVR